MRVLFLCGGMPHYLVSLLNSIQKTGIDVHVILPDSKGNILGKGVMTTSEGFCFKTLKLQEYKTWYGKFFFKNFNSALKEIKPDILILSWPYILALVFYPLLLLYLKLKNIKIILREIPFQVPPFQDTIKYLKKHPIVDENLEYAKTKGILFYINGISLKWIRKFYYSVVDATLNYCEKALDIQPGYGVKREKIFICHNTPDTELLSRAKEKISDEKEILKYNPHRIIHIGRLVKWKRVDLLIQVVARLKEEHPNTELIIIGKGPEEESLIKLCDELRISQSVKWAGAVYNYEDIGKYFTASSVYVLAGMGGLSINEAMAFQKPVVCSIADGTEKKLVRHGYNGLYFKEGDANDLFEMLNYLFSNPEKIKEMGRNSEKIINEEVNIRTVTDNYIKTFMYVLKK